MTDLMKISPGSIHNSSDGLQKSKVVDLFVNRNLSYTWGGLGMKSQHELITDPFPTS